MPFCSMYGRNDTVADHVFVGGWLDLVNMEGVMLNVYPFDKWRLSFMAGKWTLVMHRDVGTN